MRGQGIACLELGRVDVTRKYITHTFYIVPHNSFALGAATVSVRVQASQPAQLSLASLVRLFENTARVADLTKGVWHISIM